MEECYQLTKVKGFLVADCRHEDVVLAECTDRWQRVVEGADSIELQVMWHWRLRHCSNGTRLRLTPRLVLDFVNHVFSQQVHTGLRVPGSDKCPSTRAWLNIT